MRLCPNPHSTVIFIIYLQSILEFPFPGQKFHNNQINIIDQGLINRVLNDNIYIYITQCGYINKRNKSLMFTCNGVNMCKIYNC